ncbi:hypothetical protein C6499_05160 [Candidatus Poribacteria bacterium]|nr:MAG: hypothetical protein C6499_05160 [Candidatus Poribacteria bacterium]
MKNQMYVFSPFLLFLALLLSCGFSDQVEEQAEEQPSVEVLAPEINVDNIDAEMSIHKIVEIPPYPKMREQHGASATIQLNEVPEVIKRRFTFNDDGDRDGVYQWNKKLEIGEFKITEIQQNPDKWTRSPEDLVVYFETMHHMVGLYTVKFELYSDRANPKQPQKYPIFFQVYAGEFLPAYQTTVYPTKTPPMDGFERITERRIQTHTFGVDKRSPHLTLQFLVGEVEIPFTIKNFEVWVR